MLWHNVIISKVCKCKHNERCIMLPFNALQSSKLDIHSWEINRVWKIVIYKLLLYWYGICVRGISVYSVLLKDYLWCILNLLCLFIYLFIYAILIFREPYSFLIAVMHLWSLLFCLSILLLWYSLPHFKTKHNPFLYLSVVLYLCDAHHNKKTNLLQWQNPAWVGSIPSWY